MEQLSALWQSAPAPALSMRVVFPLVRQTATGDILQFTGMLTPWCPFDTLWALDLHPADGATWGWLDTDS